MGYSAVIVPVCPVLHMPFIVSGLLSRELCVLWVSVEADSSDGGRLFFQFLPHPGHMLLSCVHTYLSAQLAFLFQEH